VFASARTPPLAGWTMLPVAAGRLSPCDVPLTSRRASSATFLRSEQESP
jgi:hypothetical protein